MSKFFRLGATIALAQFMFIANALASAYGSSTYNKCAYDTGCAAAEATNNSSTTSATNPAATTVLQGSHFWLWLSIVAVILAAIIFLWLIAWKRRRKRDNAQTPSTTPPTYTPSA